jgi:hypothetical protein
MGPRWVPNTKKTGRLTVGCNIIIINNINNNRGIQLPIVSSEGEEEEARNLKFGHGRIG